MMAGLWGTLGLPANNKLLSEHHWMMLKYNGPVIFLPRFSVFLHLGCQGKIYLMPDGLVCVRLQVGLFLPFLLLF